MEINDETVVQMRDVTKRFGDINAVDAVSLDVPRDPSLVLLAQAAAARQRPCVC